MRTTLLALLLAATACKSDEAPKVAASATTVAAGSVVDVKGTVTVAGKPLAKGDTVAADAMIDTGADSSVTILLAHNGVKLELGANKHVRVNESIAWKAPKRVEPGEGPSDSTESAGRPAERSAAETSVTAIEPQAAVAAPGATADKKQAEAAVVEKQVAPPPKPTTKGAGGTNADDSFGQGGLGISGTGVGGGGRGEGVGLGGIGTIGHGGGAGDGAGYGTGKGSLGGGNAKAPKVTTGSAQVSGSLPPEVIKRIVRVNMGKLKLCYETGLKKNPALEGKVVVKFVIAKDGSVATASDGGSTLGDSEVISCAVNVFKQMSFPSPQGGGIVTVSYPIAFAPAQ